MLLMANARDLRDWVDSHVGHGLTAEDVNKLTEDIIDKSPKGWGQDWEAFLAGYPLTDPEHLATILGDYGEAEAEARCECGWEGGWADCHVEHADGKIGPDPNRGHADPPYFCPECGEDLG